MPKQCPRLLGAWPALLAHRQQSGLHSVLQAAAAGSISRNRGGVLAVLSVPLCLAAACQGDGSAPSSMLALRGPGSLSAATAAGAPGGGHGSGSKSGLAWIRGITGLSGVDPGVLRKARVLSIGVGGLSGAIGSLVGVGGGVIISPIIGAACETLPQRVVSGTSLAAVIATGSASGYVYWSNGFVDLTSAAVIGASALLTASAGAAATHKFDCAKLRWFLGWWLYLVAIIVPAKVALEAYSPGSQKPQQEQLASSPAAGQEAEPGSFSGGNQGDILGQANCMHTHKGWRPLRARDAALAAVGGMSGFASGLLGIGGGTVVTPMLAVLSGMPQAAVVGTSLAGMALPACAGLLKHTRLNNVDWRMAAGLSLGSVLGSYCSSSLALSAPAHTMEAAFTLGMAVLGNRTLAGLRRKA